MEDAGCRLRVSQELQVFPSKAVVSEAQEKSCCRYHGSASTREEGEQEE